MNQIKPITNQEDAPIIYLKRSELELLIRKSIVEVMEVSSIKNTSDGGNPELLSAKDLAKQLGVSRSSIHSLIKKGKMPYYKVGKRQLFKYNEILEVIQK